MRRGGVILLCCVLQLIGCVDSADDDAAVRSAGSDSFEEATPLFTDISVDDIQAAINSGSVYRTIRAISAINGMRYRGTVIPFIVDLWELRRTQYPELNWDLVAEEVVRLNIANVLAQASRSGWGIDIESIRQLALRSLKSKDPDAVVAAIGILRIIDNPEDVSEILKVALEQEKATFRSSVLALTAMCSPEARSAVDKLYDVVKSE